jgi:hypothetical protein
MDVMHGSRQTITMTPWEISQIEVDIRERAQTRYRAIHRHRLHIRDQEAYDRAVQINKDHGLMREPRNTDPRLNFLRLTRGGYRSKRPITLAKHA